MQVILDTYFYLPCPSSLQNLKNCSVDIVLLDHISYSLRITFWSWSCCAYKLLNWLLSIMLIIHFLSTNYFFLLLLCFFNLSDIAYLWLFHLFLCNFQTCNNMVPPLARMMLLMKVKRSKLMAMMARKILTVVIRT